MLEEMKIEIACEVSHEAWRRYEKQYGREYVEANWDDFKRRVIEETRDAVDEAERDWCRDEAERRQAWLDSYYEENAYGFYQQDIIDMRRRER